MVAPLVLAVLLVVVVASLVWLVLVHERTDETERFHRAREITTSWAYGDPVLVPDDSTLDQALDQPLDRPADGQR